MAHTMQQHRHESPIRAQSHTAFVHLTPAVEPVLTRGSACESRYVVRSIASACG
jgi:hypothetical protein